MTPAFWAGKKVLVTGHTGFKGAWLCHWLLGMGAKVSGLALEASHPDAVFTRTGLKQKLTAHTVVDIRDAAATSEAIRAAAPDIVLHLAAQALVREGYTAPIETYAVNVMGTVHVLDALRAVPSCKAAVIITTDKCYENTGWVWPYRETDRLGGHDPYSNSKACTELVADAYRRSFLTAQGLRLATARAGNVIGGGDWAKDRLIPDAVMAFRRGESLTVRMPHAIRPWQHVLEPLAGYLLLAEKLFNADAAIAPAYNFAPDEVATVGEVLDIFKTAWGQGAAWHTDSSGIGAYKESAILKLDASLAKADLNWQPRLSLKAALDLTAAYYSKETTPGADLAALIHQQIRDYTPFL
ncbi:MAG: CDP-glucose 4,6-dehydratase [Alphaproteobacteria bacterium]|jgi:CDP-glucose 4,6-dehydratase|nr:CDP-glucose 4,6-dehydratase [Alphaproteobacteria bacterium]